MTLAPYPRVLGTEVSDGSTECCNTIGPEEPPSCQPLGPQGPGSNEFNVFGPLSALYYTVSTVGLNTSVFRPLDPGTESATRVHVHGPPSPMIVGPGVLEPRSSGPLCELAALPPHSFLTPKGPWNRGLGSGLQNAAAQVGPKNHPVASHLVPRDPDPLSPMYSATYGPVLHSLFRRVKHVCVPGTESGTTVHVHSPPIPMVVGPGVLQPGIPGPLYELATLPPIVSLSQGP